MVLLYPMKPIKNGHGESDEEDEAPIFIPNGAHVPFGM
jgi:hypothetical protein